MSYVSVKDIQSWLQNTKFDVTSVDSRRETFAVNHIFGKLSQRYDTTIWTDDTDTPSVVLSLISMWMAASHLRIAASEEDGLVSYADWLDLTVTGTCDSIVSGAVDIEGIAEDSTSSLGGAAEFLPNNSSTTLWESSHDSDGSSRTEGATTLAFKMVQEF